MTSIFDDIRNAFRLRNALNQLILINVIIFVVLLLVRVILKISTQTDGVFETILDYIAMPANPGIFLTRPWTIFTYFFTHREFFHIIFNMLNLYWFGMIIREYLGDKKLVSLYLLGGLAGGIFFVLFYNLIPFYQSRAIYATMIGASASVLAVTVAAATLLPNYTFNLLFIGPVKIKYIAAFFVLLSISGAIGDNAGGNLAHLGGALIGFVFIKQLQRGTDLGRPIHGIANFFRNLFKPRTPLKVTYKNQSRSTSYSSASSSGEPSQTEIDLILDKISRSGYESLSKDEKQKLFRASQKKD
ncbi:rhomboid family intramembrane serine protease [Adhaeribacter swui]|uniref:Rhomboid family intramembrane serine protease n=1 Tax=Adhaeribacter swui TaxID=2086471 RepID=A0A7G7G9K9_9BACT|nr:rhomboid family intramembrane serine protease [Adhaeribacter swui]QNF33843.1 rhomboid family intramembrane serine protease [Adhaeribacter swui]